MDLTPVLEAVANEYDIYPAEITSRTRRQPVAVARQVVFYILRTTTTLTLNAIGQALGRHHATVIHGVTTIERRRTQDRALDARIHRLVNNLTTTTPPAAPPVCWVYHPRHTQHGDSSEHPAVAPGNAASTSLVRRRQRTGLASRSTTQ